MNFQSKAYGKPILIIVGLCLMLGINFPSWAATPSEKKSLWGLQGILLKPLIFASTPVQIKDELPLSQLTTKIETQLRHAGLLLDEAALENSTERPFLEIQGAVTQVAADYYAYTILIELHQKATLLRDSSQPWVVTWSQGSLSTGDIQKFQDRLQLLVRMFIQDYKEMNARSAPARSLSLPSTHL